MEVDEEWTVRIEEVKQLKQETPERLEDKAETLSFLQID